MESKILNNGQQIPLIGLGGLKKGNEENIEEIAYYSIKDGIRLIETDPYLDNEVDIGKGINKAINEGLVKREELFIIGKLSIQNKKEPEKALIKTLNNLKIKYLDLFLEQWVTYINYDKKNDKKKYINTVSIYELWFKMEKLIEKGLTKSIGVCNYNIQALNNLLSFCKIKPVVNCIEFHPYCYRKNMITFCKVMNIRLLAFYPLAKEYQEDHFIDEKTDNQLMTKLKELVDKYEISPEQIILNWHKLLGIIPIITTSLINIMGENLEALNINLNKEDMNFISSLNRTIKINDNSENN